MKSILTISIILITNFCFAQSDFYTRIVKKFYSKIDSSRNLGCCDSSKMSYTTTYKIPLPEYPIFDKLDIQEYESKVMDDDMIELITMDLVSFYNKIKPSIRNNITKSCYKIKEHYTVECDRTGSHIYWVEGYLIISFTYQGKGEYFGQPWWKKTYYKIKKWGSENL